MSKEITYSLYKDSTEMEASLLRGILLFNSKEKRVNRDEMIQKALFSIILEGGGTYTDEQIITVFESRFKIQINQESLSIMRRKLQEEKHLDAQGHPFETEQGQDFFEAIENETEALFDGIIKKVEHSLKSNIPDRSSLKGNIRNALSVYFKMYGYAFFDLQDAMEQSEPDNAIRAAMYNLDKRTGESLVREIAYTLKYPSEREAQILEQWARAFITMQILGLDPTLKNFQATRLREKEFILDTDFVLRCLTTESEHCDLYHLILNKLKEIRCKLYIPEEVRKEVIEHIKSARSTYARYGDRVTTYFDEVFKSGIPNVFIEDYVKLKTRKKPDLPFDVYIHNFDFAFLPSIYNRVFGEDVISNSLPTNNIDNNDIKNLTEKILPHTESTFLGEKSTDERNREISRVDSLLYLVARYKNQGLADDSLLARKTYLVTRTTRSIRAAKECGLYVKSIVCNPDALMAILKETGIANMKDVKIINLFENPFLTYVAREMWDKIGPFIKEKAVFMKHEGIDALRHDVDVCLDEGLTGANPSKTSISRFKTIVGVYLPEDIEKMQQELEQMKKILDKKNKDLLDSEEKYDSLKKENYRQKKALDKAQKRHSRSGPNRIVSNRTKRGGKK